MSKAMRKQEGSISIAFLDLLSGALAAVIILFLVVPKGNEFGGGEISDQKVSIDSLFVVIDSLYLGKDTLTTIDIQLLREAMTSLRSRVDSMEASAIALRNDLIRRKAQQVQLEDSLRKTRIELRILESKTKDRTEPIAKVEKLPTSRNASRPVRPVVTNSSSTTTPLSTSRDSASKSTSVTSTQSASPSQTTVRDPMPAMMDPFMIDVRWTGEQDVDLLLLNKAGVVICNDSRCNKKFAAHERSGKRDTAQYERMRVISREPEEYEVRLAIHSRFGGGKNAGPVTVQGDFYLKQSPATPASKRPFETEVAPRQRGENGAPGVKIGTLQITDDGKVVFNTEQP